MTSFAMIPPRLVRGSVTMTWLDPFQPGTTTDPPVIRKPTMTRLSNLLLVTGIAILPIGAFAQQSTMPVTTPTAQLATITAPSAKTDAKSPVAGVKTVESTKHTKPAHTKLGTTAPVAPAKTAEPGKS
jgi:hypothetical protein